MKPRVVLIAMVVAAASGLALIVCDGRGTGSTVQAITAGFSESGCIRRCVMEGTESGPVAQVHALHLNRSTVDVIGDCVLTTRRHEDVFLDVSFAIKLSGNQANPAVITTISDSLVAAMGTEAVFAPPPNVIGDTEGTTFIDFWDGQ